MANGDGDRDPEKIYGPTDAWQGGEPSSEPAPAVVDAQQPPPAARQIDQELVNYMDRRYNAALAEFATKLQKDLLEAMDQKLVATLNTQAALNSPTPQPTDGPATAPAPGPTLPSTANLEALATAVMPIINMIASRFLKVPAAEAPAGILQARFKEVADVVTMVNSTFMANHDESMRTGMKLTADAFTYAYKATGNVPDGAVFNAAVTAPTPLTPAAPGGLSRTVDVDAEGARIGAKIAPVAPKA